MSVTNDLQQSMLDAMQLLSEKAASNTGATLTVKCTITDVVDAGLGLYEVKYGENKFNVYNSSGINYVIDDIVYIVVPDGDFSQQKFIIGSSAPKASMLVQEDSSELFIPISENLFDADGAVNLRSWMDESNVLPMGTTDFNTVFNNYLNTYKNFVFTASIKTEIDKDHQMKGNYGLILYLPFLVKNINGGSQVKTPIWRSYNMDVSTIQGNPYDFNVYQKVNLYYTVDDELEYDTSRTPFIEAFTEGFGYTAPRTDIPFDIYIKDIGVKMIDVLTEEEKQGYSLTIVSDDGNYFLAGRYNKSKTLKPILKIKGVSSKVDKWECYWFVEDASIDTTSKEYLNIGGLGWRCLNKRSNVTYDAEGNQTFQYVTNQYSYIVSPADVVSKLRYKCVLVQDDVVVGDKIQLINLNAEIDTQLVSATGSTAFVADVGYVDLIARVYYQGVTDNPSSTVSLSTQWQRFDQSDNYLDNDFYEILRYNDPVVIKGKTYLETEIRYPCSEMDHINTVNCTFYATSVVSGEVVKSNLGTSSIVVSAESGFTYGLSIQGGDVLYKYDADGDSPMVANYDGPISSRVTTIDPISFKVFKADGSELTDVEYLYCHYKWSFPKNSMMTLKGFNLNTLPQDDDYYYIEGYGRQDINYSIVNTYNKKKNNNTIILSANFDNVDMADVVSPKFLKDGESGTNGSKYSAVITYDGYAYGERDTNGKVRKLQLIYVVNDGWKIYDINTNSLINFNNPRLGLLVYKDGERITSGYSFSWSIFDSISTNPCISVSGGTLSTTKSWTNAADIYCNTVQVQVTANEVSDTNSQESIYVYYPIEITRLQDVNAADNIIPNLEGGFEEVVFASDGTNPQYDNSNPFHCVDNLYNDDVEDYYDYAWSSSTNLKVPAGTGSSPTAAIKPVTKFDNGESKNYVKVILTMSAARRQDVIDRIAVLTTRISDTQDLINFYTHNKSYLYNFLGNFDYDTMVGQLDNARVLLSYRGEMLNDITNALNALENINTYCINTGIRISDFNYTSYYNSCKTNLQNAYNNLYKLGYSTGFSSLNDLNYAIIKLDESKIRSNYGAGVAASLKSFVQAYNLIITNKYQITYAKIVQQASGVYVLQSELDALQALDQSIIGLPQNTNLKYLTQAHDNNSPMQDFVNLQDQLDTLVSLITSPAQSLTTYSAFVNDLLKPIDNLLSIFTNTDYQDSYYQKILDALREEEAAYIQEKSDYEAALLPNASDAIVHIKPIVMLFNRYELSNINGWDGNKLYIDTANNQYILAPQVGAGLKKNGLFTGVVMGVKKFNQSSTQHIGLFGYSSGIQSYFMNAEDGSVIMGKSGAGQITLDPSQSKALLYSSNFWNSYGNDGKPSSYGSSNYKGQGMLIDLTTPEIRFGSGNFVVSSAGHITAKGGGSIGGWSIANTKLYSGNIELNQNGSIKHTGNQWSINQDGSASFNNVKITGGSLSIGGRATINSDGSAYFSNIQITGGSLNIGGRASIDSAGNAIFSNITATGGSVGGWTINSSSLTGGGTTLNSNGTIYCNTLYANNSGQIGGWSISNGALTGSGITLGVGGISCGGLSLGGGTLSGPGFSLSGAGLSLTSGNISMGGHVWDSSNLKMGSGATIDGSTIPTYITDLTVNHLSAQIIDAQTGKIENIITNKIDANYIAGKFAQIGNANFGGNVSVAGTLSTATLTISGVGNVGSILSSLQSKVDTMYDNYVQKGFYDGTANLTTGAVRVNLTTGPS